jgi:predicted nuclease of restriction endonuclease-like RecB superfamily
MTIHEIAEKMFQDAKKMSPEEKAETRKLLDRELGSKTSHKDAMFLDEIAEAMIQQIKKMTPDQLAHLRAKILKEFGMMPTKVDRVN